MDKVWLVAIDPFSDLGLDAVMNLVKPLAARSGAGIEAVYVLAPASLNWSGNFSGPWMTKYEPIAAAKLTQKIADPKIRTRVLSCEESGQRAAVECLVDFAEKAQADCLVILTHARAGLERMAMGSFAESILLTATVPVLVLNPAQKLPTQVRKILVPTDLMPQSEKFVTSVGDYAKVLDAEVVLFYKQPEAINPMLQQGVYSLGGGWVSLQNFTDGELTEKAAQVAKLEVLLRGRGVRVSHILDSGPGGLVESIDRAVKSSGADMISVLTESGAWGAALLGSVARGLVRTSLAPVLVRR